MSVGVRLMRRIGAVACVATLGLAASACGGEVAGPTPSTEGRARAAPSGTILFEAENGTFTIRPNGSGRRSIALSDDYFAGTYECEWSPDRQQLACEDLDSVGAGISLFGVDGSGPRDLTADFDASGFLERPSWSPDGRRVAFLEHSEDLGGPFLGDLYAVDIRTGKFERLTNTPELQEDEARWSPDGTRIAFGELVLRADGKNGVFVLELATGRTQRLADGFPVAWSPDGTALGYSTGERPGEPGGVWVYELASGRTRRLADGRWGYWSPDGATIAYVTPGPRSAIALIAADGSGEPLITAGAPSWAPDEQHLVIADAD